MLDDHAVHQWRNSVAESVSRSGMVLDDDLRNNDERVITPIRTPPALICPGAPKKRRKLFRDASTQSDLSFGTTRTARGVMVSMDAVELYCHECDVVWLRGAYCPSCESPLTIHHSVNVGYYHLVPVFE